MDPTNKYTKMQKDYYDNEGITGNMNIENHMRHNNNPDYWKILVSDTLDPSFKEKIGLDFGCGCGRNVMNLIERFKRLDGVDISPELIETSKKNLLALGHGSDKTLFYTCDGVSLSCIDSNTYDFIMSTIVLQHICVYDIRYNYLKEFYRILKSGGMVSFQMGYGDGHSNARNYYENYYDATGTNSGCDVKVDNPEQLIIDLNEIGFVNVQFFISSSYSDSHNQWIYIKAHKE